MAATLDGRVEAHLSKVCFAFQVTMRRVTGCRGLENRKLPTKEVSMVSWSRPGQVPDTCPGVPCLMAGPRAMATRRWHKGQYDSTAALEVTRAALRALADLLPPSSGHMFSALTLFLPSFDGPCFHDLSDARIHGQAQVKFVSRCAQGHFRGIA